MSRAAFSRYIQGVCASRVQFLAFLMGVWFVMNWVVGMMIDPSFPTHSTHEMYVAAFYAYGVIPVGVNGWHAFFHLATGIALLIGARTQTGAIRSAAAMALVYWAMLAVCVLGGMTVCSVMAVDTVGNWVHGSEGVILAGIAVYGLVSSKERAVVPAA
ncbi:DUF4383 domain-containing protein [Mycobacteroides chelonae]|uniref:DUF4383 domain-containing protein n=1 Tax=Mycobacteroides chelonae TaxID=1774 RepID=UPI0018B0CA35|nr:DUF4383 domain-containing protein [Mycobacteroides chelonae]MBF9318503.1 DUF4383 domain-containing protein [Mycobacteroides chelonae]